VTLTGERRDASVARTHARRVLGSLDPAVADDVLLVVSELVTNAVLHGRDPIVLTLRLDLPEVIISVSDRGATAPTPRHPDDDDERGRGLEIIEGLAVHWHVERENGRKSVVAIVSSAPAG
jgi:anti-sigma regulatory factor (Ser/Thr protein kinase)